MFQSGQTDTACEKRGPFAPTTFDTPVFLDEKRFEFFDWIELLALKRQPGSALLDPLRKILATQGDQGGIHLCGITMTVSARNRQRFHGGSRRLPGLPPSEGWFTPQSPYSGVTFS
ncbi:MAG: hypothetical protein HY360_21005 [Verrucomicrobia bacterium]|nr:hypothetical protein [Verrucomicrobiota bacterium]